MSFWEELHDPEELESIFLKSFAVTLKLNRKRWQFSRGGKTIRYYTKNNENKITVKYDYIYNESDFQNETNSLVLNQETGKFEDRRFYIDLEENVKFINEDGSIYHEYSVPNEYDENTVSRINREMRQGRISFLERSGMRLRKAHESLPPAVDFPTLSFLISSKFVPPSINTPELYSMWREELLEASNGVSTLFSFFSSEINDYLIREGFNNSFEDAVRSELDPSIIRIMGLLTPPNGDFPEGLTIREAISFQLLGTKDGL